MKAQFEKHGGRFDIHCVTVKGHWGNGRLWTTSDTSILKFSLMSGFYAKVRTEEGRDQKFMPKKYGE